MEKSAKIEAAFRRSKKVLITNGANGNRERGN